MDSNHSNPKNETLRDGRGKKAILLFQRRSMLDGASEVFSVCGDVEESAFTGLGGHFQQRELCEEKAQGQRTWVPGPCHRTARIARRQG